VLGTFAGIDWSDGDKTLVVDLDQSGTCIDFEEISNQLFASTLSRLMQLRQIMLRE
jgi:hypothetical protein